MNPSPSISVVVPTYNYARFLDTAVRSVLAQEWPHLEILVVDDASTDNTPEVAAALGAQIRYLRRETRGGIATARNHGVRHASGDYLAFLDSDDAWLPGQLRSRLEILQSNAEADAVLGKVAQVQNDLFAEAMVNPTPWMAQAAPGWMAGCMLFRRASFDRIGLFDEALSTGEFIDWVSRARSLEFRFVPHPELVLLRRVHESNTMRSAPRLPQNFGRILKAHLDRRRRDEGTQPEGAVS